MQPFTSLRMKLILVFVGLITMVFIGVGLYGYLFTRTALYGQPVERSRHQVHLQAESILSSLQQARGDALYLSVLRSLHMLRDLRRQGASAEQIDLWQHEVSQDFLMFSSARPMYEALRYIDAQGQEIVGVESDGSRVSVAQNPTDRAATSYFKTALALEAGSAYVSAFAQEQDTDGRPYLHYALKLPDDDGIILIDLHAGWLLRNLPADPGDDFWVVLDQDGRYLVYPEQFDTARASPDLSRMLSGQAGSFETADSVFVFDVVRLSDTMPGRYWVIYRQTPKSLLYADVSIFYTVTTAIILGAALLALALALVVSEQIFKPLLDLERQAAAFGRGGPVPALPERLSRDEVGMLTRTFCEMAQELERKRSLEHRLIEKLINAQEEERKLVAYDLHDGLIQQLVGARLYLSDCCEQRQHTGGCNGVRQGCAALTEAIIEGRRIVEGLRPAVFDDLGLTVAIVDVAQSSARAAAWNLSLDVETLSTEPDKTIGVTLFRVAQEALNNIRKHANATQVMLSIQNGNGIDLIIQDDGVGFEQSTLNGDSRGLGITTMKERTALIHGVCEIDSKPGQGTRVHVWVPTTPQRMMAEGGKRAR